MGWHTNPHRFETGCDLVGDRGSLGEYHGQRAGPEGLGKTICILRHRGRDLLHLLKCCDVNYKGIVLRTVLGCKNTLYSLGIEGIGRQSVHRLGGNGNYATLLKELSRTEI